MAIALGAIALVLESRSHFYPVSYLDYAFVLITVNIISHNPLNLKSIYKICWVISQSPMVVFICYLPTFDLSNRNHWGFENPNWLGLYCSMCLPLTLCLLAQELNRIDSFRLEPAKLTIRVYVLVASLVSTCLMMVSSGSRSSLYTSLVVVILAVAQLFPERLSRFYKQPKLMVYSSCFFLMSILIYRYLSLEVSFLSRLSDLANSTNLYRIKLYKCYFALSRQKPLWGWGIDRATAMCEQKLNARSGGVNHAHNFVLQISADHGLIITLSILATIFFFLILPSLVKIAKFDFNCNRDILHLGVFYSSLSILIVSLFQSGFYGYPLFPLWLGLLWGCQLNLIKRKQKLALEEQKSIVSPLP
ncbi:MAG: O-antigen ligase family protein [Cyanobacteria bacterium P01_C01_bin.72]